MMLRCRLNKWQVLGKWQTAANDQIGPLDVTPGRAIVRLHLHKVEASFAKECPQFDSISFLGSAGSRCAMADELSRPTQLMGILSAALILIVGLAYAVVLTLGFASQVAPNQPIGDPYFTVLEALILVLAPAMVALMASVHAWSPHQTKGLTLAALIFTGMMATITCSVHFTILTLSGQRGFTKGAVVDSFYAFKWPSVVYALEILAWDVFFALAMLFAASAFRGGGLYRAIRITMVISGLLALVGLIGVPSGDMMLRNIGIGGYLGAFLVVDGLLLRLFIRPSSASPRAQ